MENIQNLLVEIQREVDKVKQRKEEARKRGESFNVFNVLGLSTNETRTHSAFISELLNPSGNHGCGSIFLEEFIRHINLEKLELNLEETKVEVERSIGMKNIDVTEGGRLDIVLQSKDTMIVIENKIYARDQEKQLLRYWNYAQSEIKARKIKKVAILYLTLDGHKASEKSVGNSVEYTPISYRQHILSWLNDCIGKSAQKPLVRETIIQYSNLIKQLTNQDMDTTDTNQMYEIMVNYPDSVSKLLQINQYDFMKYLYEKYIKPDLIEYSKAKDLIFDESNFTSSNSERKLLFRKVDWENTAIYISCEGSNKFFCGISYYKDEKLPISGKLDVFAESANLAWPYGWIWLNDPYSIWSAKLISYIINKKYSNYIIELVDSILSEIERKSIHLK